jgi:hypothetical protein
MMLTASQKQLLKNIRPEQLTKKTEHGYQELQGTQAGL